MTNLDVPEHGKGLPVGGAGVAHKRGQPLHRLHVVGVHVQARVRHHRHRLMGGKYGQLWYK